MSEFQYCIGCQKPSNGFVFCSRTCCATTVADTAKLVGQARADEMFKRSLTKYGREMYPEIDQYIADAIAACSGETDIEDKPWLAPTPVVDSPKPARKPQIVAWRPSKYTWFKDADDLLSSL